MIVLDTSVLSHAWRRARRDENVAASLTDLIRQRNKTLAIPGIVVQELLAAPRTDEQRDRLEGMTRSFRILLADRELHIEAADIETSCVRRGITPGTVDCLIAAHTLRADADLFTVDEDFKHIAKHTGLRLYVM